jgi:hypothetical protein
MSQDTADLAWGAFDAALASAKAANDALDVARTLARRFPAPARTDPQAAQGGYPNAHGPNGPWSSVTGGP